MTLTLTPYAEQLLAQQLVRGGTPEEILERALERLAEQELHTSTANSMTPAEAVDEIRELRQGVTLGGLRIRDLVNEGRKSVLLL